MPDLHTPAQIAAALLDLFGENGERWTRGSNALNSAGTPAHPGDDSACCWCIVGGLIRLGCSFLGEPVIAFSRALTGTGFGDIDPWNDSREWPEVRAKLREIAGLA